MLKPFQHLIKLSGKTFLSSLLCFKIRACRRKEQAPSGFSFLPIAIGTFSPRFGCPSTPLSHRLSARQKRIFTAPDSYRDLHAGLALKVSATLKSWCMRAPGTEWFV